MSPSVRPEPLLTLHVANVRFAIHAGSNAWRNTVQKLSTRGAGAGAGGSSRCEPEHR